MKTLQSVVPETYRQLAALRKQDVYLPVMDKNTLIADFFPPTLPELVLSLSNITAVFYGLMLKTVGEMAGEKAMDTLSKTMLYELGKRTAKNVLNKKPGIPKNARGIADIAIIAVFNASPEYCFEVLQYDEHQVKMQIKGTDRYYRIALELDIARYLTWPVIVPFLQGINDALDCSYRVHLDIKDLNERSECLYDLTISP